MSTAEELVSALRKRIAAGHSRDDIKAEAMTVGHTEEIFEAAYTLASESKASADLPTFITLWKEGWQYMCRQWKFTLLLGLPLVVLALIDKYVPETTENIALLVVGSIVGVVAMVVYIALLIMLLRIITKNDEVIDYADARSWAKQHWLKLVWLYILLLLIVWGGFMLLIIPGLVISLMLYFTWFVYAVEGESGEAALVRSRALVKCRFWTVAGKLVGVGLINLAAVLALVILGSIVSVVLSFIPGSVVVAVYAIIGQLLGAAIAVISLRAGFVLYQSLKDQPTEETGVWLYRIIGLIGLLSAAAVIAFVAYLSGTEEGRAMLENIEETEGVQAELSAAGFAASAYRLANSGSYEGVCAVLNETASAESATCNDSGEAWALGIEQGSERWCADSTGYNKLLEVPLDDRTKCLPI